MICIRCTKLLLGGQSCWIGYVDITPEDEDDDAGFWTDGSSKDFSNWSMNCTNQEHVKKIQPDIYLYSYQNVRRNKQLNNGMISRAMSLGHMSVRNLPRLMLTFSQSLQSRLGFLIQVYCLQVSQKFTKLVGDNLTTTHNSTYTSAVAGLMSMGSVILYVLSRTVGEVQRGRVHQKLHQT